MNFIKVKKINLNVKMLEKLLASKGMSLNDIDLSKELDKYSSGFSSILGTTMPSLSSYTDGDYINLDLDKVIAVGDIVENILGDPNLKGFSVWFDHDAEHCWFIYAEYYDAVSNALNFKKTNKPLFD